MKGAFDSSLTQHWFTHFFVLVREEVVRWQGKEDDVAEFVIG